jgi:hypothetical protein
MQQGCANTAFGYKEAGLWLRTHAPPGAKIMTNALSTAVYADRPWVPLPSTDWGRFLHYARAHEASQTPRQSRWLDERDRLKGGRFLLNA